MKPIAIGIDLGTTNSVAAFASDPSEAPRVLANSNGENLTPSVVFGRRRADRVEFLVGRPAVNLAEKSPIDAIYSIKRLMGRDRGEPAIQDVAERFHYEIVAGPNDDPRAHVKFMDSVCSPAEISAMILEKIKSDAGKVLNADVTDAVITVPAYFNEGQRAATREAGVRAGLNVKRIIDEPTAAAVAFGIRTGMGARHRILVFDLGGGTFDVSILQLVKDQLGNNLFTVLQYEGDNWLGGDDFDWKLVDMITSYAKATFGVDPSSDRGFRLAAKKAAEEAKRALTTSSDVEIAIPSAYRSEAGTTVDVELNVTREQFDEAIRPFIDRTMTLVQKAMTEQSLTDTDISDVLLVGGSTLVPLVYKTIENRFGSAKVRRSVNPMESVALGAAVLAATMQGIECPNCGELNDEQLADCSKCGHSLASGRAKGTTSVEEVTVEPLGIAAVKGTMSDVFVPIIPKNTPYPLPEPMRQSFQATSGRLIRVPVYEGDHPVASQNKEQGVIEYELPEDIGPDQRVEVSFNYDRNRTLTVIISVPGTNLLKVVTLAYDKPRSSSANAQAKSVLPEDEWEEDLMDTIDFARRFLQEYDPFMEPSQRMRLQRDIDRAQQILSSPEEVEGKRVNRMLQADVFNSGIATQLFLADRATDGASPELSEKINEAARAVREAFERGARDRVTEMARHLKVLVAKRLESRSGVRDVADQEDYGGLLKLLGH